MKTVSWRGSALSARNGGQRTASSFTLPALKASFTLGARLVIRNGENFAGEK